MKCKLLEREREREKKEKEEELLRLCVCNDVSKKKKEEKRVHNKYKRRNKTHGLKILLVFPRLGIIIF